MGTVVMSALCQKRTRALQQIAPLFDQLVGARQQRLRDGDAERLCRLEIDHQFKFGRRLDRKIGGLLTLEDAINVIRGTAVLVDIIGPIRDEAARSGEVVASIDGRQSLLGRQCNDAIAIFDRGSARRHDEAAVGLTGEIPDPRVPLHPSREDQSGSSRR